MTALTSEQQEHLLGHNYVWVKGVGVLWKPPAGALRRARFTHGDYFRTQRGEFYMDSGGNARELSNHSVDHPASAARPPIPFGDTARYDDFGGGDGLDNAVPSLSAG